MVECKSDQILNSKTGRCVKKTGKIGQEVLARKRKSSRRKSTRRKSTKASRKPGKSYKPCKSHQYRDSKTKRCRNTSKKPVVKPHSSTKPRPTSGGPKPCKKDEIRNPKTGRCVKKAGKIGKEILAGAAGPPIPVPVPGGPGIPIIFSKIAEDCAQMDQWTKGVYLGQGAYGEVYEMCKAGNCEYALKTQKADPDFGLEVEALTELQSTGVVPKLYAAWTCKGTGYIIMEKMYKCDLTVNEKYEQSRKILDKMEAQGWLHVDTHSGNLMCGADKKRVIIIDFGWAAKKTSQGSKQLYPNHPMAGTARYNCPVPWSFLKALQEYNFQMGFSPFSPYLAAPEVVAALFGVVPAKKYAQKKAYLDAQKAYDQARKKLCQQGCKRAC